MKILFNRNWIFLLGIIFLYPVLSLEARKSSRPQNQPKGPFVSSTNFKATRNLWNSLSQFITLNTKEDFETKCNETSDTLNKQLIAAEKNGLIGRWIRRFFESEFVYRLNDIAQQKGFETSPPQLTDAEVAHHFGKELDFLHEGFYTLQQMKEYDNWLSHLLIQRIKRVFESVNQISFKKRLDYLNQSRDQYKEKLIQIQDTCQTYRTKSIDRLIPSIVGKVKGDVSSILARRPGNDWQPLDQRRQQELYTDDLIEVQGQIDKIILLDRRYLVLEPNAILMGWELTPKIPSNLKEEINKLIVDLGNDEWSIREKATKSLIEIGKPAVPALEKALDHKDPEVRLRAKIILDEIGRGEQSGLERQVRELVAQMGNMRDPNWNNAYQTLINMARNDTAVVNILQKMLNEINDQRVQKLIQTIISQNKVFRQKTRIKIK